MHLKSYEHKIFMLDEPNGRKRKVQIQLEKHYLDEYKRNKTWYIVMAWFFSYSEDILNTTSLHKNLSKEGAKKRFDEITEMIESGNYEWLLKKGYEL